ncbi:DUF2642 domain-containing protein [Lederbergia wuyishanensis]|uniref:DUF2642 domain-containing protein n=1 Tax=Lederbergia wuyishanensis TaxID=1347903 RepID=A0ABU0D061_9BACI|nr:DUF2642 domain-containing protein [Lederbergia wuyishanensis]MCJ8006420.1 DUF2642 domain-containing protein [Lederbergia wuyishanensis]MDQ0341795.1 hypothetical protein [Lederbergia wuyishanensis]
MKNIFQSLSKEVILLEISGKKYIHGTFIDSGSDILVLYNGKEFVYIPLVHIQNFKVDNNNEYFIEEPPEFQGIYTEANKEELSLRKILTLAKGMFVKIYVTSSQPLSGYITSIMNNYFVFHSPVYKTMYITLNHLKWLIPYSENERPYNLSEEHFPVQLTDLSLSRTFEVQVSKFKNKMVMINIGEKEHHIGKINNVQDQIVEIQTADPTPYYLTLNHIKTLHQL